MVRPGNSQYPQQNQPSRFNHGAYAAGRNVPEGLRGPPGAPQQGSRQARPQSMSAHYQGESARLKIEVYIADNKVKVRVRRGVRDRKGVMFRTRKRFSRCIVSRRMEGREDPNKPK